MGGGGYGWQAREAEGSCGEQREIAGSTAGWVTRQIGERQGCDGILSPRSGERTEGAMDAARREWFSHGVGALHGGVWPAGVESSGEMCDGCRATAMVRARPRC